MRNNNDLMAKMALMAIMRGIAEAAREAQEERAETGTDNGSWVGRVNEAMDRVQNARTIEESNAMKDNLIEVVAELRDTFGPEDLEFGTLDLIVATRKVPKAMLVTLAEKADLNCSESVENEGSEALKELDMQHNLLVSELQEVTFEIEKLNEVKTNLEEKLTEIAARRMSILG